MRILCACIIAGLSLGVFAQDNDVAAKIREAMAGDVRSERDLARDRNRKPVETLEFFQLSDDMRVLELLPGGGWYTKLLAPVLRENGELYIAIGLQPFSLYRSSTFRSTRRGDASTGVPSL